MFLRSINNGTTSNDLNVAICNEKCVLDGYIEDINVYQVRLNDTTRDLVQTLYIRKLDYCRSIWGNKAHIYGEVKTTSDSSI